MTEAKKFNWAYVFDEPTRFLVVDDDPILREFASVYLSTPVATVETLPDGTTALDRLRRERFDVVMLDIDMPELDGFDVLERIRADDRLAHLPVVMLTGREDIQSIDKAYSLGATSFVTKPVNWRELSYQLRYVIRANRALRLASTEFTEAVSAMVEQANLIAERSGTDASRQAQQIAALGQDLLRKMTATQFDAEAPHSRSESSLPKNAA
jgi:DNA-binding response OmpR family regulator